MVSHKIPEIFNKVIKLVVTPYIKTNSDLMDCRLYLRGDRYDLVFTLTRPRYNNERILLGAILETCNDLFSWVDISHEVRIVVEQRHNVKFFSYFELIYEVLYKDRGRYSSIPQNVRCLPLNKEENFYKWLEEKPKRFFNFNFI